MTVKDQLDYKSQSKQSPNPYREDKKPQNNEQHTDKPCKNSLPT